MADKCHPFFALTVSHFWGALQDTYPRENAAIGMLSLYLTRKADGDLPRGVRGFKPELDAEQSGPVISGTWLPK